MSFCTIVLRVRADRFNYLSCLRARDTPRHRNRCLERPSITPSTPSPAARTSPSNKSLRFAQTTVASFAVLYHIISYDGSEFDLGFFPACAVHCRFDRSARDEEGNPKGDGSVCYVKPESVEMAINVLHGGQLRPGVTIEVRRSFFCRRVPLSLLLRNGGGRREKTLEAASRFCLVRLTDVALRSEHRRQPESCAKVGPFEDAVLAVKSDFPSSLNFILLVHGIILPARFKSRCPRPCSNRRGRASTTRSGLRSTMLASRWVGIVSFFLRSSLIRSSVIACCPRAVLIGRCTQGVVYCMRLIPCGL